MVAAQFMLAAGPARPGLCSRPSSGVPMSLATPRMSCRHAKVRMPALRSVGVAPPMTGDIKPKTKNAELAINGATRAQQGADSPDGLIRVPVNALCGPCTGG